MTSVHTRGVVDCILYIAHCKRQDATTKVPDRSPPLQSPTASQQSPQCTAANACTVLDGSPPTSIMNHISDPRAASVASFLTADTASRRRGVAASRLLPGGLGRPFRRTVCILCRVRWCTVSSSEGSHRAGVPGIPGLPGLLWRAREGNRLARCADVMETSLSHAVAEGSGPHAIGCVLPPCEGRPRAGQWEATRQLGD